MHIGKRLRQARMNRHLSQEALAEALGVSSKSISRWEQSKAIPQASIRIQLSRFFHLSLEALFGNLEAHPHFWSVPYPRNPFFVGRETVLSQLHEQLQPEHMRTSSLVWALSGLGGIGKTQIALEYAYRYAQAYAAIFWIRAETVEHIVSSMVRIAEALGLPECKHTDLQRIVGAVQRWLATSQEWLLIWDNLEHLELLRRFLPATRHGVIFITTRHQALGTLAHRIEVLPMELEEGIQFVLQRARVLGPEATREQVQRFAEHMPAEYQAVQGVVRIMDRLPLALDQAGAYIEETGCSFSDYLSAYHQQRASLLSRRRANEDHPHSVFVTFALASKQLEQVHLVAADVLHVCALLHAEAIPEELFTAGASYLGLVLLSLADDRFRLDQALAVLRSLSLVQRQTDMHQLSIHRLVQEVLLEEMDKEEQAVWTARVLNALNALFPENVREQGEQCERLLPHVLHCAGTIEDVSGSRALAEVLGKAAKYLGEHARYEQAEPLYQRALRLWEPVSGTESRQISTTLMGLAWLYYRQGKYTQAEPVYQQALHLQEQREGTEHLQIIPVLNGLALLLYEQGRYAQAEALYLRALHIWEHTQEREHSQIGMVLNNLGLLYTRQGRYQEAEDLYQGVLHIREQVLGPHHPSLAFSLIGLAILFTEQERYEQAEPFCQRALRIRERVLEAEHPDRAVVLYCLARVYTGLGKYEQAERLFQRTRRIEKQVFGSEHPYIALVLHGLAQLYAAQHEDIQAEQLYRQALSLREQILGEHHADTAETLHDLACLRERQGCIQEASSLSQRALLVREKILGREHPKTRESREEWETLSHLSEPKLQQGMGQN